MRCSKLLQNTVNILFHNVALMFAQVFPWLGMSLYIITSLRYVVAYLIHEDPVVIDFLHKTVFGHHPKCRQSAFLFIKHQRMSIRQ